MTGEQHAATPTPPERVRRNWRRVVRRTLMTLAGITLTLILAVTALWQWPTGFYRVSTFVGRTVCGLRIEVVSVDGKVVPFLANTPPAAGDGSANAPTPILFLHGYGTSKEAMMAQIRWFSSSAQVIAPDLPAFGDNPLARGEAALTGEEYVQWIEDFRIAAKLPRVDVIGESMGGALAAAYAAKFPESVRRVVLESPAGLTPPHENALMKSLAQGTSSLDIRSDDDFERVLHLCFVHPPHVPAPIRRYLVAKSAARVENHPEILQTLGPFLGGGLEPSLGSIRAPTLVIYGDRDQITDCSMLPLFVDGISGSQGMLIPGAGHVVFADAPSEVRSAVRSFLDR